MKPLRSAMFCLAAMLPHFGASAHEVHDTVSRAEATVVTLTYPDGSPMAGAAFEVRPEQGDTVVLSGRTDARGRAVFLLDGAGPWRFRSQSIDGHGVDRSITSSTSTTPPAMHEDAGSVDRNSRIVLGVGVLFAVFGIQQLWLRHRRPSSTTRAHDAHS